MSAVGTVTRSDPTQHQSDGTAWYGGLISRKPYAFFNNSVDARHLDEKAPQICRQFSASRLVRLKQTHSTIIHDVSDLKGSGPMEIGDGFIADITKDNSALLAIQTADCVPVLISSSSQLAFLHVGWRGLADGIVQSALKLFSGDPVYAVFGPHAMADRYEVGREILTSFLVAPVTHTHVQTEKCYLDMAESISQILRAKAPGIEIVANSLDTISRTDFHSVRRDGSGTGRNLSIVSI